MKPPLMRPTLRRYRRQNQRGFALLLVFLMASAVALMLYMQVPREAFESERDKEQLLIDRGQQYKRAIYLYYISNNRQWPSKMEDLESTNNHRYLRERFVDPYTGKNEWRLIHTNGAFLTDSLVTPPPAQATPGTPGGAVQPGGALAGTGPPTTGPGFSVDSALASSTTPGGATDPNAPPAVNATVQRRASDLTMVQNSNYQNIAGGGPSTPNNDPGYQPFNPAALPPITMYPNGYNAPPVNGQGVTQGVPGTQPQQPGNPGAAAFGNMLNQINSGNATGVNPANPNGAYPLGGANPVGGANPLGGANPGGFGNTSPTGTTQTGTPGFNVPGTNFATTNPGFSPPTLGSTGFGSNSAANSTSTSPFGSQPFGGQFGGPSVGQQGGVVGAPPGVPGMPGAAGGANNQAINLINNLLTQPRQPPAGIGPNQNSTGGGGLAGVASTYKGTTIKSYGDRTKYQEWEFVFQLNAQGSALGAGSLQAPAQGPNGSGGLPSGGPLSSGSSSAPGFGTAPASPFGAASSSGFGTNSGAGSIAPNSPFGTTH